MDRVILLTLQAGSHVNKFQVQLSMILLTSVCLDQALTLTTIMSDMSVTTPLITDISASTPLTTLSESQVDVEFPYWLVPTGR